MKRKILMVTALLSVTVGACTRSNQIEYWEKPGVTQAQWQADKYECERDTRSSFPSFGGGEVGAYRAQQFYQRCLFAKGYSPHIQGGGERGWK